MGVIKAKEEMKLAEGKNEAVEILTEEQLHEQDLQRIKDFRLMDDDFLCSEPDDMFFKELADRARYFKKDEGGVKKMCKMLEDMRNEEAIRNSKKIALRMIADGKLSIEMIAQYTELPVEEVRKLAGEKSA